MKKYFYALLISCMTISFEAQTKNHHCIGADVGYATWPGIIGYKFETNFNYFYAYKHFCTKLTVGVAPATNFGTFTKAFLNFGYTTNVNEVFSWHAMLGLGGITDNKQYDLEKYTYDFATSGVLFNTGIYYKPQDYRLAFGLHVGWIKYMVFPTGEHTLADFDAHTTTGRVVFMNFSASFKLNGAKKEKPVSEKP